MQDSHGRSVGDAAHPMLFMSISFAAFTLLLTSCSVDIPLRPEAQGEGEGGQATSSSIVCIIHGDGDYRYHDADGNEVTADEEALAKAKRVAERNPQAEVFIFHQKPRRHFLFIFPRRDGEFYYYRNGQLIANDLYWRGQGQSHFAPEVELRRRFPGTNQSGKATIFLYFGHEIPESDGVRYDASYPERTFAVHDLARGLGGFMPDSARFDLLVLSTCFGGTPHTIGALAPFARTIIASPGNLHLSYFDFHSLERLDLGLADGDVPAFAGRFAQRSFDRLTRDLQTDVSVAVYDADRVQKFLLSVQYMYDRTLTSLTTHSYTAESERCDCADLPAFVLPTMTEGVDIFYRPARFGRSKGKQNHSGWECWRERDERSAGSQSTETIPR